MRVSLDFEEDLPRYRCRMRGLALQMCIRQQVFARPQRLVEAILEVRLVVICDQVHEVLVHQVHISPAENFSHSGTREQDRTG